MRRKLFVSVMAAALAVVMMLGVFVGVLPENVEAASSSALKGQLDELKNQKKELDAQIGELEAQLSENLDEMTKIIAQKDIIDQEIFAYHQQVQNINDQVSTLSVMIGDKQTELEEAQVHLDELNRKNKERIRAMEEDGELSYWSVLFKANDFADLLDRINMVSEIAAADQRRLREMRDAAQVVADAKAEMESQKAELEATKETLDAAQVTLEEKRAEADKLLADLIATGDEYQAYMDEKEAEMAKLEANIDDVQDQYDDAKYKEWLATSVPPTTAARPSGGGSGSAPTGGNWLIPCNYTRFSSPFGWRTHPIYGDRRFHYGVDLAAPSGTPIVASRSGTVTTTSYDSSSGYYVTINHGDGFQTKYLHMTHYIVSPGQSVTAGQVIGYVGSTGASTGPHLHFSVLYNGSHVNPANYINI